MHIARIGTIWMLLLLAIAVFSCAPQDEAFTITQYSDPNYVTGIAPFQGDVYCATKGGLVRWNLATREYQITTSAEGLPSNVLTDVIVDGAGRLWVACQDGVAVQEGLAWHVYGISDGLPSPEVNDLAIDRDGNLWVATNDGAASFNGSRFMLLSTPGSPGRQIINSLYFDRGNNLWICTEKTGVYFRRDGTWDVSGLYTGLPTPRTDVLTQAWDLGVWTGSSMGIFLYGEGGWAAFDYTAQTGSVDLRFIDSTEDRLWFFVSTGVHASHGSDWWHFTYEDGLLTNDVTSGYVASDLEVFVGTSNGLSAILNGPDGIIENYAVPNTPIGSNFISLAVDTDGHIFTGTWEEGMGLFNSGYWTLLAPPTADISLDTVRSTVFGPDGIIMFNTMDGLVRYQNNSWSLYTRQGGLSADDVRCGVFDDTGRYWAGTATGITYGDAGTWRHLRTASGIPSEDIWSAARDESGRLWFGTTKGIVAIDGNEVINYTPDIPLNAPDIRAITAMGDTVYAGTNGGRLITFDGTSWDVYSTRYVRTKSPIYDIVADPDGTLWLATYGEGVVRVRDGNTRVFTVSDGLPSNYINALERRGEAIWGAAYGGVFTIEEAAAGMESEPVVEVR